MLIVQVQVQVRTECIADFMTATLANAEASLREPGVARFDVLRQADDSSRFVLIEAYRDARAPAAHKETAHYTLWRDTVASMMAAPRMSQKYQAIHFPDIPSGSSAGRP